MKSKKMLIALILAITVFICPSTFAAQFSDVPQSHWAYDEINKASEYGFMDGMGDGTFGIGTNVTRAQFASMIVRMFGLEKKVPESKYSDVDSSKWYYNDVDTLLAYGIAQYESGRFRPDDKITREEMTVMLVRSLGYGSLAQQENSTTPFTDVSENKGYINLAYDFGIVSGRTNTEFDPKGTATREEAAAMMVRCYEKYNSKINFLHGFYAFSSYSQKDMAGNMNAVSFGWSRLEENNGSVVLNTLYTNGNEWAVPQGYENIVEYLKSKNVKTNLNIFMSAGEGSDASDILSDSQKRSKAVQAIMDELTVSYKNLGYNPYSGVTIDFENLRSTRKSDFVSFLKELKGKLDSAGKTLYVTVQPPMEDGSYFDGYDFKEIGNIADKVILMAYDYNPTSISQDVMESGFTTTPVSPFDEVYYGLKVITDSKTGIQDKNKIVLGLSFNNVGWNVVDGKITNSKGLTYTYDEIEKMIQNGAVVKYSDKYRNPYLVCSKDGSTTVWYENAESIKDKCELAKMFGINGVSFWRLGMIPNDGGDFNIWSNISALR